MAVVEQIDQEQGRFMVHVPDFNDFSNVEGFARYLEDHTDTYGVKTLLGNVNKYLLHVKFVERYQDDIKHGIDTVNGVRSKAHIGAMTHRKFTNAARAFYEGLSTAGLRTHCQMFNIDYNAYDTQEEIIDLLVEKHKAMLEE